ncbi:hypothetical protein OXIME_000853 [Oxyplasma meridianum]|uniref:DMT family transporter n=1 Tax=Oxyplasma meridianum TaxID=3073602 RepID=A0AAX4NGK3_9ARCH
MDQSAKRIPVNLLIISPAILLIFYIVPKIDTSLYLSMLAVIMAIPFIKHLTPLKISRFVYPVSVIAGALVFLNTILIGTGIISPIFLLGRIRIPLTLTSSITFFFSLGIIFAVEGIFAKRIHGSISYLFLSLGTFLDQLAIAHTMTYTGVSYFTAAYSVYLSEAMAIFTLILNGYQLALPLADTRFNIDPFLLLTFSFVVVGFIASFLIEKDEDRSVRANSLPYPIITGAMIGFAVFVGVDVLSRYGLQIFGVSVAILIMIIVVRKSSKSADNLAKRKMKETEAKLKEG